MFIDGFLSTIENYSCLHFSLFLFSIALNILSAKVNLNFTFLEPWFRVVTTTILTKNQLYLSSLNVQITDKQVLYR